MTQIVTVNVSQTIGATPDTLQKTGAFVSQGGTTLTPGTLRLLTQAADLSAILTGSVATTSLTLAAGVVTVVTTAPHGIPSGDTIQGVIAGVTPTAYNGTFACTYIDATSFSYPLVGTPGAVTVQGNFTLEDVGELVAMNTTFFAQGNANGVYVLELGAGTAAQGVTALTGYINNPTIRIYNYLLPFAWADEATAITMAGNYSATTSKQYFTVSCTASNFAAWVTASNKAAMLCLRSPMAPVTEFDAASVFWVTLNYAPSNINQVTPLAFSYVVGVVPYNPTLAQQSAFKTAKLTYIGTGAEGGISNTMVVGGFMGDGQTFNYWYSVDWSQINIEQALANEIINGSNNPQAPLYYNQAGINRLQKRAQTTLNSGITFGMLLGPAVVNAVPFVTYTTANPNDYGQGIYNGLSATIVPQNGFQSITFNLQVTNFITG